MALVLAYDDAKVNQERRETPKSGGEVVKTPFFTPPEDNENFPHAAWNHRDPGRYSKSAPHFHQRDQFQVVVGGKGSIGRHVLAPYVIHFTRGYTPYGPLIADPSEGLSFFVMRARKDRVGGYPLATSVDMLKSVPNRQPWQVTRKAVFPDMKAIATAESLLQAVPGIKDEHGLAAYTLSMKANAHVNAPDATKGDGQYLLVVKGSLLHQGKEHKAYTLVFVEPKEGSFNVQAGAEGLHAFVLNFPEGKPHVAPQLRSAVGFKKWQCELCEFAYDEALGIPEEGIAAGTRWEDVPESWSCPDCSASKSDFRMVEV